MSLSIFIHIQRIRRAIARDPSLSQPILTFSHAPRSPHSMEPGDVDVEEDEVEPSQSTEDNNNNPGGLERRSSVDNRTLSSFLAKFPVVRHPQPPPTLLRGNKFTQAFQGIVDTYGIPRYQEANPGLFTIITFPFLFGVMFGDIGHGLLMILAGIVLVLAENSNDQKKKQKKLSEFLEFLHNGRYLILVNSSFPPSSFALCSPLSLSYYPGLPYIYIYYINMIDSYSSLIDTALLVLFVPVLSLFR